MNKAKKLAVLDATIIQGEGIPLDSTPRDGDEDSPEVTEIHQLDEATFSGWKMKCLSLLNDLLPEESPKRFLLEKLSDMGAESGAREFLLENLRNIRAEIDEDRLE